MGGLPGGARPDRERAQVDAGFMSSGASWRLPVGRHADISQSARRDVRQWRVRHQHVRQRRGRKFDPRRLRRPVRLSPVRLDPLLCARPRHARWAAGASTADQTAAARSRQQVRITLHLKGSNQVGPQVTIEVPDRKERVAPEHPRPSVAHDVLHRRALNGGQLAALHEQQRPLISTRHRPLLRTWRTVPFPCPATSTLSPGVNAMLVLW